MYDVIIVGGGVIGSSIAYSLGKLDPNIKVCVIEKDTVYTKSSSTLSLANIRIQFGMRSNILISQYAFEIFDKFNEEMSVNDVKVDISFRHEGNLFLVNNSDESKAKECLKLQKDLNCDVDWLSPDEVRSKYPIFNIDSNYCGATYSPNDGHLDANSVLRGYLNKAKSQGVEYIENTVSDLLSKKGSISGVKLESGEILHSNIILNCAGGWAAKLLETASLTIPVIPKMRQVFVLDPAQKLETTLPLTVLPSGLYFRSETGGLILLGKSLESDKVGFDFKWDPDRFYNDLWPELAEFVPSFDQLKLLRGWAGIYSVNTFDNNAILGEWPDLKGLYLANGFSGHGLQQAPAVGRYLAELITRTEPELDLSEFSPLRILENKPLYETGIV